MRHIGRYRLDAVEGSGAFATVWRGHDDELSIPVAVKVLAENWSHHADVRERFLEEARLLRRLQDDRVVRVHDVGVHEGQPYFVMDHVDGGTLADRADGSLEPGRALDLAAQAARAVAAVHEAGVLHRDVKPSNLLVERADDAERVLVADLGSAKRLAEASGFTVTTGTPAYMPPEQALGQGIDERSDVYALGVLTYVLVTGELPFEVAEGSALLVRPPESRPRPVGEHRDLDPTLASSIDAVVLRATAHDPEQRHPTAAALAEDLEAVAGGEVRTAPSPAHPGLPAWLVVVLALVVFGVAAGGTWAVLGS
ncbi:MAG: serine/threonine-protein kinase [Aeromicrobium erythreum]